MVPPAAPPTGSPRPDAADGPAPARSPRQRLWIALGLLVGLASMAMWFYVLLVYDPGRMTDELEDRTFPRAAEAVCARAERRLEQLPPATSARTPEERADTIDEANRILGGMVDELEPLAPDEPRNVAEGVRQWLEDWRAHIADRDQYASALRDDPGARFLETTKGDRQISRAIDGFAEVNRMGSCEVPPDVG